jgi:acetoin utilization deacetylase AcuC-like enzyme
MIRRAKGKPTPGACVLGGGYTAWFSVVSSNSGLVSMLKNSTASVDFDRR